MKSNIITHYKAMAEMAKNPKGVDSQERAMATFNAKKNMAMYEAKYPDLKEEKEESTPKAAKKT